MCTFYSQQKRQSHTRTDLELEIDQPNPQSKIQAVPILLDEV